MIALIHEVCGQRVTAERRTVIAQPHDRSWPRDVIVAVPYCNACGAVVGVDQITLDGVAPSAPEGGQP